MPSTADQAERQISAAEQLSRAILRTLPSEVVVLDARAGR